MIKGAQKKMIVVKTNESRLFEEAYFVLRRDADCGGGDMVEEADRIIAGCGEKKGKSRRLGAKELWAAAIGFLCGSATAGSVALILANLV